MREGRSGAAVRGCFAAWAACRLLGVAACGGGAEGEADAGDAAEAAADADAPDVGREDGLDDAPGEVGPDGCVDVDRDGWCRPEDCDDEDALTHPGAAETCGNGLDDDCDGEVDEGCAGGGRVFFVDRDSIGGPCSDDGPGTETSPWCTVGKANATLAAGDAVRIRAGTYAGETIRPANSGASERERITYEAHGDEAATFTGSVYCIRLQERRYVTIRGLRFRDCERNLYLDASSRVNVGFCTFDNPAGPTTWAGSRIFNGSRHNRIHDCTFSRYGMQSGEPGAYDDTGCILDIGNDNVVDESDHNLVVNSTFFHGGHHILGVYADHNVVRGNTFHNEEWYPCHRSEIGGLCGNRNVILNTSDPSRNVRNVIERNRIAFSGVPPDQDSSTGLSVRTRDNIVRRNLFFHNDASGLGLSADGGNNNDASGNHIYANVFLRNGRPLADDWDPLECGLMLARWVDDAAHNAMTGVAIRNNLFRDNGLQAISFYYVARDEQDVAGNREEGGDPGFLGIPATPDPFDLEAFDFRLGSDSPCIDAGVFLTRTVGAGADDTVIAVEDAGYFSDGKGLVAGDMIQLDGSTVAVTVTAVDYDANTIDVDAPLTWAAGTGVALPYAGTAPDQGAHERW